MDIERTPTCLYCGRTEGQAKAGLNEGTQRFRCAYCKRRYTPSPSLRGYTEDRRLQASLLHAQGIAAREIGRRLGVSHQTVVNWLRRPEPVPATTEAPEPPAPESGQNENELEEKRPTIRDVARIAGVSNSTVSNYLNGKGYIGQETRLRLESAIDRLNFTPNALVRAIRHRRTRILGVLLFGINELDNHVETSLSPPLLSGINQAADDAEYNVLLYPGWLDRPHRHPGLPFLDGHIDGLLWVAPEMHEPILERVAAARLPVVALLSRHVPVGVGYVNADNVSAIQEVVAHLVGLGHERIAYLGPAHSSNFIDRRDGFRQSIAAAGLPWNPELEIIVPETRWTREAYAPVLDHLLSLPEPPTAIVSPNDGLAAWIVEEVGARGLRIPQDISVTGFDDIPYASQIHGGLTTIRQPFRDIGRVAVERLLALIEGAPIDECRVTLPASLIARNTTGPVTSPDSMDVGDYCI